MKLKDLILDRTMITMEQLCKEIKVSRQTIYNIIGEKENYKPSLLTIKRICNYFGENYKDYIDYE